MITRVLGLAAIVLALAAPCSVAAQQRAVSDLVVEEGAGPVRLMGYGLVTGLSGTGDRVTGNFGARHTVQSIANLLRNFDIEVPAEMLRTRNVAAVLVVAEVSPYLRAGGRFDVHVSSIGDAPSLQGGALWVTPLIGDVGGQTLASAQGAMITSERQSVRVVSRGAASARIPGGGLLEADLPRPRLARSTRLMLRDPDLGTAQRIVAAIDAELGQPGAATVEDPGAILLVAQDTVAGVLPLLARVRELRVNASTTVSLLIDARNGTVVAGADLPVAHGVVTYDGITLVIGSPATAAQPGTPESPTAGATVKDVAEALQAVRASGSQTAGVFLALRDAGALRTEVIVR